MSHILLFEISTHCKFLVVSLFVLYCLETVADLCDERAPQSKHLNGLQHPFKLMSMMIIIMIKARVMVMIRVMALVVIMLDINYCQCDEWVVARKVNIVQSQPISIHLNVV